MMTEAVLNRNLAQRIEMQLLSRNKWQHYLSNNNTTATKSNNTSRNNKSKGTSRNTALEAILTGSDPLLDVRVLQATCPYLYGLQFAPMYAPSAEDENVETNTRDQRRKQEGTMGAANDDVLQEILRFCSDDELGQSVAPTCSRMRKVIGGLSFLRALTGPKFADSIAKSLEEQSKQDIQSISTMTPGQIKNTKREKFEQQRDWPARLAGDLTQVRDMLRDAITESNVAQMKSKRDSLPPAESFVLRLCEAVPDVVVRLDLVITALTIGAEMEQHRRDLELVCDACELLVASPTNNQELLAESQHFGLAAGLVATVLMLGNTLNSRRGAGSVPPARAVDMESVLSVVQSLRSRFDSEFTGVEQLVLETRQLFDWDEAADDAALHVAADALEIVSGNRFNPPNMQAKFDASQDSVARVRSDVQRCARAEQAFANCRQQSSDLDEENKFVHMSCDDISRAAFFEQMGTLLRLVGPKANHLDNTLRRARAKYQTLLAYVGGYGAIQGLTGLACACRDRVGPKMAPIEVVRASALDNIALEKNAIGESAANAASKRGRKANRKSSSGAVAKAFQQARDNVMNLTNRYRNAVQERRQERRREIEAEISGTVSDEHRESTAARLQRMLNRRMDASETKQRHVGVQAEIRNAMTSERREQVSASLAGLLDAREIDQTTHGADVEQMSNVEEDGDVSLDSKDDGDFAIVIPEDLSIDNDEANMSLLSSSDKDKHKALLANIKNDILKSLSSTSESETSNESVGACEFADDGSCDESTSGLDEKRVQQQQQQQHEEVEQEVEQQQEEQQKEEGAVDQPKPKPNTPLSKSVNWTVLTAGGDNAALWDDVSLVLATAQARATQAATLDEATLMLFSTGPHIALSRAARSKMKMLHFTSDHFQGITGATIGNNVRRDLANAVLRRTLGGGSPTRASATAPANNGGASGLVRSVTPPPVVGPMNSFASGIGSVGTGNGYIGGEYGSLGGGNDHMGACNGTIEGEDASEGVAVVYQSFSLAELQQVASGSVEGVVSDLVMTSVDRAALERNLSDEDFETCFEMSRERFNGLAKWRRDSLKRDAKLF